MLLLFKYENNAWGTINYTFTIKLNGDVHYEDHVTKQEKKICKLTEKTIERLFATAEQIKSAPYLVNNGRAFDAGSGNFYLVKQNTGEKILLHSDGNHKLQSTDQKVIYIVSLMKQIIKVVSNYVYG